MQWWKTHNTQFFPDSIWNRKWSELVSRNFGFFLGRPTVNFIHSFINFQILAVWCLLFIHVFLPIFDICYCAPCLFNLWVICIVDEHSMFLFWFLFKSVNVSLGWVYCLVCALVHPRWNDKFFSRPSIDIYIVIFIRDLCLMRFVYLASLWTRDLNWCYQSDSSFIYRKYKFINLSSDEIFFHKST